MISSIDVGAESGSPLTTRFARWLFESDHARPLLDAELGLLPRGVAPRYGVPLAKLTGLPPLAGKVDVLLCHPEEPRAAVVLELKCLLVSAPNTPLRLPVAEPRDDRPPRELARGDRILPALAARVPHARPRRRQRLDDRTTAECTVAAANGRRGSYAEVASSPCRPWLRGGALCSRSRALAHAAGFSATSPDRGGPARPGYGDGRAAPSSEDRLTGARSPGGPPVTARLAATRAALHPVRVLRCERMTALVGRLAAVPAAGGVAAPDHFPESLGSAMSRVHARTKRGTGRELYSLRQRPDQVEVDGSVGRSLVPRRRPGHGRDAVAVAVDVPGPGPAPVAVPLSQQPARLVETHPLFAHP